MITQKHGRKLASQLGEVLFVCQFYDLQIVKKTYLSLRNLWLHLVQMCVCPPSPQRHYTSTEYIYSKLTYFPEGQQFTKKKCFYWSYEVF